MGTAKRERKRENRQLRLQEVQRAQQRRQRRRRATVIAGFVAALVAVAAVIALVGRGGDDKVSTSDTTVTSSPGVLPGATTLPVTVPGAALTGATPCPAADGSSPRTITFVQAPPTCVDPAKTYTAAVETNKGSFTLALDAKAAPISVNNFVVLARYHYYDGTPCHRIIADFAVQCGDPTGTGGGPNPGYTIAEERPAAASAYTEGVVAMAKTAQPNSTGGQFFVVVGPDPGLTPDYSILGKVAEGYDTTVAAMEAAADPSAQNGVPPKESIVIQRVTITEA